MAGEPDRGVIEAAGGLLWRESPHGRELAVIYRTYRKDWTLPKGHLKRGETWLAAAVREVLEETGCQVQVEGFAGCVSYVVNGTPKVVLYWNMLAVGAAQFAANDEVEILEWLLPEEALKRLQYSGERRIVNDVLGV